MTEPSHIIENIRPESRQQKVEARLVVLGLNKKEMAILRGIAPAQFLYLTNSDHRKIKGKTLRLLAEMLGVSVQFLTDHSWEGLLDPVPSWLEKKLIKQKKDKIISGLKGKGKK